MWRLDSTVYSIPSLTTMLQLFVLATDLDIRKTTWADAQTNGSRGILVWESGDGVSWSEDSLIEVMPATAGYVSVTIFPVRATRF